MPGELSVAVKADADVTDLDVLARRMRQSFAVIRDLTQSGVRLPGLSAPLVGRGRDVARAADEVFAYCTNTLSEPEWNPQLTGVQRKQQCGAPLRRPTGPLGCPPVATPRPPRRGAQRTADPRPRDAPRSGTDDGLLDLLIDRALDDRSRRDQLLDPGHRPVAAPTTAHARTGPAASVSPRTTHEDEPAHYLC